MEYSGYATTKRILEQCDVPGRSVIGMECGVDSINK